MTKLRTAARRQAQDAWILMRDIGARTADGIGITRAAFGPGENVAAEQVTLFSEAQGTGCAGGPFWQPAHHSSR